MKVFAESRAAVYPSSLCAMAINGVNPPAACWRNCLGKSRTNCSPPASFFGVMSQAWGEDCVGYWLVWNKNSFKKKNQCYATKSVIPRHLWTQKQSDGCHRSYFSSFSVGSYLWITSPTYCIETLKKLLSV